MRSIPGKVEVEAGPCVMIWLSGRPLLLDGPAFVRGPGLLLGLAAFAFAFSITESLSFLNERLSMSR